MGRADSRGAYARRDPINGIIAVLIIGAVVLGLVVLRIGTM
jgi:hypothetical protein